MSAVLKCDRLNCPKADAICIQQLPLHNAQQCHRRVNRLCLTFTYVLYCFMSSTSTSPNGLKQEIWQKSVFYFLWFPVFEVQSKSCVITHYKRKTGHCIHQFIHSFIGSFQLEPKNSRFFSTHSDTFMTISCSVKRR